MDDVGEGPELLLEAIESARVEAVQRLQGDAFVALPVEDLVDDAHAAASEAAEYLVARRALPAGEAMRSRLKRCRVARRLVCHACSGIDSEARTRELAQRSTLAVPPRRRRLCDARFSHAAAAAAAAAAAPRSRPRADRNGAHRRMCGGHTQERTARWASAHPAH